MGDVAGWERDRPCDRCGGEMERMEMCAGMWLAVRCRNDACPSNAPGSDAISAAAAGLPAYDPTALTAVAMLEDAKNPPPATFPVLDWLGAARRKP